MSRFLWPIRTGQKRAPWLPRDRMGTVASSIGIARGIASILVNNGIGRWVTATPP